MWRGHVQLDDVWMSESTHVLDLALHTGLGFGHVDDGLGYVLHGDPLSGDGMCRHCIEREKEKEKRVGWGHQTWKGRRSPSG